MADETTYCGLKITAEGISPMTDKLGPIKDMPVPTSVYHVRSFLGMAGFYRKFIPNFAQISAPLVNLTCLTKNRRRSMVTSQSKMKFGRKVTSEEISPEEWTQECQDAFDTLKERLMQAPVLALPDHRKPYVIMCDASRKGVGAVLMQRGEDGHLHPIAYFSKKLSGAELNINTKN